MPMLTPICIVRPSLNTGIAQRRRRSGRRTPSRTRWRRSVSGTTTANSSPPRRPTKQSGGRHVSSRRATSWSRRSPRWCPRASLTSLNRRGRASAARAAGARLASSLATWVTTAARLARFGEAVVAGLVADQRLALAQVGDVDHDAADAALARVAAADDRGGQPIDPVVGGCAARRGSRPTGLARPGRISASGPTWGRSSGCTSSSHASGDAIHCLRAQAELARRNPRRSCTDGSSGRIPRRPPRLRRAGGGGETVRPGSPGPRRRSAGPS